MSRHCYSWMLPWGVPIMWLLYVIGGLILVLILNKIISDIEYRRLAAARREYGEIEKQYGHITGREHCPHKVVQFGQTGTAGVITLTTKWCKVCGKNLGPATLKKSFFGNRWT